MSIKSDYENVLEFTRGTKQNITKEPTPMNDAETLFLIRMLLSEIQELALTMSTVKTVEDSIQVVKDALQTIDKSKWEPLETDAEKCAAQVDSVVDMWYYSLNAFSKKCIDPSAVFNVVHESNMAKRDPETKQFIIRPEDGKIIKPADWKAPDISIEIKRQINEARKVQILAALDDRYNDLSREYVKQRDSTTPLYYYLYKTATQILSLANLERLGLPLVEWSVPNLNININWISANLSVTVQINVSPTRELTALSPAPEEDSVNESLLMNGKVTNVAAILELIK